MTRHLRDATRVPVIPGVRPWSHWLLAGLCLLVGLVGLVGWLGDDLVVLSILFHPWLREGAFHASLPLVWAALVFVALLTILLDPSLYAARLLQEYATQLRAPGRQAPLLGRLTPYVEAFLLTQLGRATETLLDGLLAEATTNGPTDSVQGSHVRGWLLGLTLAVGGTTLALLCVPSYQGWWRYPAVLCTGSAAVALLLAARRRLTPDPPPANPLDAFLAHWRAQVQGVWFVKNSVSEPAPGTKNMVACLRSLCRPSEKDEPLSRDQLASQLSLCLETFYALRLLPFWDAAYLGAEHLHQETDRLSAQTKLGEALALLRDHLSAAVPLREVLDRALELHDAGLRLLANPQPAHLVATNGFHTGGHEPAASVRVWDNYRALLRKQFPATVSSPPTPCDLSVLLWDLALLPVLRINHLEEALTLERRGDARERALTEQKLDMMLLPGLLPALSPRLERKVRRKGVAALLSLRHGSTNKEPTDRQLKAALPGLFSADVRRHSLVDSHLQRRLANKRRDDPAEAMLNTLRERQRQFMLSWLEE